jgi:uncharacterized protein YdbL (DUF1318 family)
MLSRNLFYKCTFLLFFILTTSSAHALNLDEAKSSGLVGEQTNGYLAAVTSQPSPEVLSLVNDINGKRKEAYQNIAKKNGTALAEVEKLAAEKAIEKTLPGHYLKINGQWMKK